MCHWGISLKRKDFEFSCVQAELEPVGFPCRPLPIELTGLLLAVLLSSLRNQEMIHMYVLVAVYCSPGIISLPNSSPLHTSYLTSVSFPQLYTSFCLPCLFPFVSFWSAICKRLPFSNRSIFLLGQQVLNTILVFLHFPFSSIFICTPSSIFVSV